MTGDRIPCLNPRCRRTAPAGKYEPGEEIVCGRCWKLLPKRVTDTYKALNRHERRLLRLVERRVARRTITREKIDEIRRRMEARKARNWAEIRSYFLRPEKPVGLDNFLKEVGFQ